jgi:hypothetical protein
MVLDPWDVLGDLEMTEHWRSVVPALSTDVAGDLTGVGNDQHRVAAVRRRYALELKHLTRTERSSGFVTIRLTRISAWSPLTDQERALAWRARDPVLPRLARNVRRGGDLLRD